MSLLTRFENDYAVVASDPEINALKLVYKRRGTPEEFRNLHLELVKVFRQFPKSRLFVDVRKMVIAPPEEQKWVANTIIPQLVACTDKNFLHIAVVLDENVFAKLAVDTIEQLSNELGICLNRHFQDEAAAREWLAGV